MALVVLSHRPIITIYIPPPTSSPPDRYEPLFLQTSAHPPLFIAEPCVVGPTRLQKYDADTSVGINLGEQEAFTAAVKSTLLDGAGHRAPVRVQVGWDANDYQLDISTELGKAEAKRMLSRDASVGITHAIFAPRNTAVSTYRNSTDAWDWEETLWLGMGEQIRTGQWSPQRQDPIQADLAEMLAYAKTKDVKLLAYVYPVLPFVGEGAEPRNLEGWLYDGRRQGGGKTPGAYQPGRVDPTKHNCTQPHTVKARPCSDTRASLASTMWQHYLAETMIAFVDHTGCGGFAFDYTGFNDWRQPTDYAEWRGWMYVTKTVRVAHPDIVIDNRQQTHGWGPWALAAGSYNEPIAGDENPES